MITLTANAQAKVKSLLTEENKVGYGFRVSVKGGGCHGFEYGMGFEPSARPDDQVLEFDGVKVFVDPKSMPMLAGSEVDYVDAIHGSGFAIKNPKAKGSCGCGQSFSA